MLHDHLLVFQEKTGPVTADGNATNVLDVRGGTGGRGMQVEVLYSAASVTGGTGTVKFQLQESDDNVTFTDLAGQTVNLTTTASKGQVFVPALTSKRYLRLQHDLTGTGATINYFAGLVEKG